MCDAIGGEGNDNREVEEEMETSSSDSDGGGMGHGVEMAGDEHLSDAQELQDGDLIFQREDTSAECNLTGQYKAGRGVVPWSEPHGEREEWEGDQLHGKGDHFERR